MAVVVGALTAVVAAPASPASAVPAAVATTRTVAGFPRWYSDQNGTRIEQCLDPADAHCVVLANPGIYDPALPQVFPTNFPDESFYSVVDSDRLTTPGCAGTAPGRASMRVALESAFADGIPIPGAQIVFGRVRFIVTGGLCPNTPYTFTHPYGQTTITTEADGSIARKNATVDIGCLFGGVTACDFTQPLLAPVFNGFLKWDPAVLPAADPGYLGTPGVLHRVTGSTFPSAAAPTNFFRVTGGATPVLTTNLFSVSGKIAGPLQSNPETLDGGNQPVGAPSAPRVVTFTNVGPAPVAVSAAAVSPIGSPWVLNATTCVATIPVDGTCTATLTFTPTALGPVTASLNLTHGSFRSPMTVPLIGTGTAAVAPNVTATPITSDDFGRILLGTTGGPLGFVVKNFGPGTLNITNLAVIDSAAGAVGDRLAFAIAGNDCPATGVVAGASCIVTLTFQPSAQRPFAASLQVSGLVGAAPLVVTTGVKGRGGIAVSSTGLDGFGPDGIAAGGFPTWYQDDRGVRLGQCLNAADPNCIVLADATFNPALPVAFPTNFPGEAFYYLADSDRIATPGCGAASAPGIAGFRAATEQTFLNGSPVAGEQMVFNRIRLNVTKGLCPGQRYTFVHPYGEFSFVADDLGGLPRAAGTVDIGCAPTPINPCNFNFATYGNVSDGYLRWDTALPAPPAGYIGDAATLHTVAGAPYIPAGSASPANFVKLIDSAGNVVGQTNLFTVMGKVDPTQTATKYQTVTPTTVSFPTQSQGTTSAAQTVTIESVGTSPLNVAGVAVTGANAADFTATSTCGVQAPTTRCTIGVTFSPTAAGPRSAALTIVSDAGNAFTGTVPLSGIGGAPAAPVLAVAPASLSYVNQVVGTTSAGQAITVSNTGTAPMTVTGVAIGGANGGDFAQTNTCAAAVAPGGSCAVNVTFAPTAAGTRIGNVTVTSNGGTATVALTGIGTIAAGTPTVVVTPATLAFGNQTTRVRSAPLTVTITNSGSAAMTIGAATIAGANAADFATPATTCAATLASGASCTRSVTFQPAALGARTATLTVVTNATNGNAVVALTGTGLTPVANGSFETPVLAAGGSALNPAGTGWTLANARLLNNGNAALAGVAVPNGAQAMLLAGNTASVTQSMTLSPGSTLTLRAMQGVQGVRQQTQTLVIFVDGVNRGSVTPTVGAYGTFTVNIGVTTQGAHTLAIFGGQAPSRIGANPNALLDAVSVV